MNRTVLINRLKLAASLIGSSHSLSQRRGISIIMRVMDDLKQLTYDNQVMDFNPHALLAYLQYQIKKDNLTYKVLNTIIKNQEASWQSH